ncbi:MAG TPA: hypothetical protein VFB38_05210 [Chthonomonadaceae bacterium]|nr:hypothetical protein [Chthonomonadaceae bacterium]
MNDTVPSASAAQLPADVDGAILQLFAEIDQALAQMKRDQKEIATLKAETQALQAETETMFASIKGMALAMLERIYGFTSRLFTLDEGSQARERGVTDLSYAADRYGAVRGCIRRTRLR